MRDPSGIRAEFDEECRRVGVRLDDVLHLLDPSPPRVPGLHAIGFDLAVGLEYLQAMPDNAGTIAFVECMRPHLLLAAHHRATLAGAQQGALQAGPRVELSPAPIMAYRTMREIDDYEEYLLAVVCSLSGDDAARDRVLERRGIYTRYAEIFDAYLELAGDGVEGAEALRRATFLYWCSATQPACLTGVAELAESQELDVVETLDHLCERGTLDPQLRWMLGYYHGRFPAVFGRFEKTRALQRVLRRTFPEAWRAAEPETRDFEHRGLMGRFWNDVITSATDD